MDPSSHPYWVRQTAGQPAFIDIQWSRPENKKHAGKLLIIGGNLHGFSAPASAYNQAEKSGIGTARVLLPDAIHKIVGKFLPEASYGPSTPSGSFASRSLADWLEQSAWADGVLIAGDLGRNSETAIVMEGFLSKYQGKITLTKDAVDYVVAAPQTALDQMETTLVLSFAQLQKLATNARFTTAFTFDMDLIRLVDALHQFTAENPIQLIVKHLDMIIVAVGGQVSTTKLTTDLPIWRVTTAATAAVWWLQHPTQSFQALTTAVA